MTHLSPYNKDRPFLASIKERYLLSKEGSNRKTYHLVINIKDSGLVYEVGDSLGVFPWHDQELVIKTLQATKISQDQLVLPKNCQEPLKFASFLKTKANLTEISPQLFKAVMERQTNSQKKEFLQFLLEDENREAYKAFIEQHAVWDFLQLQEEVSFSADELAFLFKPLLPRFYSISSAQKYRKDEVHLTVASLEYKSNGLTRRGVCTHFLSDLVELDQPVVPVFIQSSHSFRLPENHHETALIMIGPGTGVAPFRAFLEERLLHHGSKGKHWLFFGEQYQAFDFYYEEEWALFRSYGHLDVDSAFSRDQEEKIYVQHRMYEQGAKLFEWLEAGAYLYVCGDADQMAKDVEKMLQTIIQEFGGLDSAETRNYIKRLRQEKRYLRDVY